MKRPNVYIAISDDEQQLMIDGDLDLFDRFVKLLQGDRESERRGLLKNAGGPVVPTSKVVPTGQGGERDQR